ncbi:MAG: glutathione S-transferase N-terminal domain-containing protein [Nanoarchaeota archaeon]|nr:glutathione S-transferase N-terminal domain-containing protein [Nanoarchaeota archaeon]
MIKLYQFDYCPYCEKVKVFMEDNGIEYESVIVDRSNKPVEVTSTGGTVPVIEIDGKLISDSSKIIEYLKKNVLKK